MPWLAERFSHEGKPYEFPLVNPPPPGPRIKVREELRKAESRRSVSFTSPESDREAPLKLVPVEPDNVSAVDEPHRSQDEDEFNEDRLFERAMIFSNLVNHGTLRNELLQMVDSDKVTEKAEGEASTSASNHSYAEYSNPKQPLRHEFWEPGVYVSPSFKTARDYARPHQLFGDGNFYRCVLKAVLYDPDQVRKERDRGGGQVVIPGCAVVIVGVIFCADDPPFKGEERFEDWQEEPWERSIIATRYRRQHTR
eukprot:Skav227016  [mRNA]  locus=scaffold456:66133:68819:+ [translate_table: standard]